MKRRAMVGFRVALRIDVLSRQANLGKGGLQLFPIPYFTGAFRFSSSNQFTTTLTWVAGGSLPPSLIMRKRWPSGETS